MTYLSLNRIPRTLIIAAVVVLLAFTLCIQRFLAITHATGRGVLVVEAWIPNQSLKHAANIYINGSYRYLVVAGIQPEGFGGPKNYNKAAADELGQWGAPANQIVTITLPYQEVDRTFKTADGFKKWLLSVGPDICCVDVYTVGVHARKSWITFQSVLGSQYQVGVIAGPETSYDPNYWVVSRRGIWVMARNFAGYLYSKYEIAVGAVT